MQSVNYSSRSTQCCNLYTEDSCFIILYPRVMPLRDMDMSAIVASGITGATIDSVVPGSSVTSASDAKV